MDIRIVSPARPGSGSGNAVTAKRYAGIFRSLGHRVRIAQSYEPGDWGQLLVALHAKKSARSVLRFRKEHPKAPIIVVLTGTDVYRDIDRSKLAQRAMRAADKLVGLQPLARKRLPRELRGRFVSIIQSSNLKRKRPRRRKLGEPFRICVLGHLRYEKDPLRVAYALELLPKELNVEVIQAGEALQERYAIAARKIEKREPRYHYVGKLSQARAHKLLADSDLLVLPSRMEGGANVLIEALAIGTSVLVSRIDGNIGILGRRYPGLFPSGDTRKLSRIIASVATNSICLWKPGEASAVARYLITPRCERSLWNAALSPRSEN